MCRNQYAIRCMLGSSFIFVKFVVLDTKSVVAYTHGISTIRSRWYCVALVEMSFTQQDGMNLQGQVATLLAQMQVLMDQNANITSTFDQFRAMASREITNLKAAGAGGGGASGTAGMILMSAKYSKPHNFSGMKDQEYKGWRKKFLTYVNLQCPGFRTVLEWVEKRQEEIDAVALGQLNWTYAAEADPKLGDFLSMTTSDNAQRWSI